MRDARRPAKRRVNRNVSLRISRMQSARSICKVVMCVVLPEYREHACHDVLTPNFSWYRLAVISRQRMQGLYSHDVGLNDNTLIAK